MSVAAVIMDEHYIAVVTDSKMSDAPDNFRASKIYQHKNDLVAYSVGNAWIDIEFFRYLKKRDPRCQLNFRDTFSIIWDFDKYIREKVVDEDSLTPEEKSKLFACVGICGVNSGFPQAITTMIDIGGDSKSVITSQIPNELNCKILTPPGVTVDTAEKILRECVPKDMPDPFRNLPRKALLFVNQISHLSETVDHHVQYWIYDLQLDKPKSYLYPFE